MCGGIAATAANRRTWRLLRRRGGMLAWRRAVAARLGAIQIASRSANDNFSISSRECMARASPCRGIHNEISSSKAWPSSGEKCMSNVSWRHGDGCIARLAYDRREITRRNRRVARSPHQNRMARRQLWLICENGNTIKRETSRQASPSTRVGSIMPRGVALSCIFLPSSALRHQAHHACDVANA